MTRAALTKLVMFVILAFIICLPEFFSLHRVSKVNFHCLPYRACEREEQAKKGEHLNSGEDWRKNKCDPLETSGSKEWQQVCTKGNHGNMTGLVSQSWKGRNDPEVSCFICETDMNMKEVNKNSSSSAQHMNLEVSVDLQFRDAESMNLTLYGRYNHSSLHLHPPEEEEEQEDDEGHKDAFFYCPPLLPTAQSANHNCCLLWLANQTVLTVTAKEKLPWKRTPKDEWRCTFRVLWLVLVCVVFLTIAATVFGQIYHRKCPCRKPKIHPVRYNLARQQLNDGEKGSETTTPKVLINPVTCGARPWSVLSAIEEVDPPGDTETLLEENTDYCHNANLHHRCPASCSSSSDIEEQTW
ncbi:uncharacterized protein LOC115422062 [Sphaeramia orbicularis]|uniref:uncharacterized protein LOC115422062 n=1 Tax=Sphaeramia orbicularis TaxID=375764 RepID=UPI00117E6AF5|nr:uncharacterized protein LOC115422062 [Sphaeramia orbicularis]